MALGVAYIKIAKIDGNGVDQTNTLQSLNTLVVPYSGLGNQTYNIQNRTEKENFFLYQVQYNNNIPSSSDTSSVNYDFSGSISPGTYNGSSKFNAIVPISDIITQSFDTGFYDPTTQRYTFNTYAQKDITIKAIARFKMTGQNGQIGLAKRQSGNSSNLITYLNAFSFAASSLSLTQSFSTTVTPEIGYEYFIGVKGPGTPVTTCSISSGEIWISSSAKTGTEYTNILEPNFSTNFSRAYGCQPTLNNVQNERFNPFLQDIDYSTGVILPVNYLAIQNNTADKSTVPESNYTQLSSTNIRYNGSKNQSEKMNQWTKSLNNKGTFGKTSPVDSLDTNIYEFEWGGGTTPEIPGWGALKMGKILNVQTVDSVRTINPSEGLTSIVRPYGLVTGTGTISNYRKLVGEDVGGGAYPSCSTGSYIDNSGTEVAYWKVSQSLSDYYYSLNGNNPINSEISLQMYPNSTAGSNPTIPNTTKILTADFGVPTISNYALTSSYLSGSTAGAPYGTFSNSGGGFGLITLTRNAPISKLTTDSNGFYQSAPYPIKPNWGTIGDEMVKSLNKGERWFITLFNEFEFPNGQGDYDSVLNSGSLSPFNEGYTDVDSDGNYSNPLANRGVYEIIGNWDQFSAYFYLLLDTPKGSAGSKNIGGGVPGNSLGMLIWKARATGKNEFVIVQDQVTGGVQEGAFTSRYAPKYITENFEQITKTFGSNPS